MEQKTIKPLVFCKIKWRHEKWDWLKTLGWKFTARGPLGGARLRVPVWSRGSGRAPEEDQGAEPPEAHEFKHVQMVFVASDENTSIWARQNSKENKGFEQRIPGGQGDLEIIATRISWHAPERDSDYWLANPLPHIQKITF